MGPLTSNRSELDFKCDFCQCSYAIEKALKVHLVAKHTEIYFEHLFSGIKPRCLLANFAPQNDKKSIDNDTSAPKNGHPDPLVQKISPELTVSVKPLPAAIKFNINDKKQPNISTPDWLNDSPRTELKRLKETLALKSVVFLPNSSKFGPKNNNFSSKNNKNCDFSGLNGSQRKRRLDSSGSSSSYSSSGLPEISENRPKICLNRNSKFQTLDLYRPMRTIVNRYPSIKTNAAKSSIVYKRTTEARRKARRARKTPYYPMPGGVSDLSVIFLYYHTGTADLLRNLTCKSTKLFRERNLYIPVNDSCNEMPRFLPRNKRYIDDAYFSNSFPSAHSASCRNLGGLSESNYSSHDFCRYARKALIYDDKMRRLQTFLNHSVQNLLHLLALVSVAGEKSQHLEEIEGNCTTNDDSCTLELLKCYRIRRALHTLNNYSNPDSRD